MRRIRPPFVPDMSYLMQYNNQELLPEEEPLETLEPTKSKRKRDPSTHRQKELDRSADKIDKLERIPELPNEFNLQMSSVDSPNSPEKRMRVENNAYEDSDDPEENERDQSMADASRPRQSESKNRQIEREPS